MAIPDTDSGSINQAKTTGLVVGLPFTINRAVAPEWAIALASIAYPMNLNRHFFATKGEEIDKFRNGAVDYAIQKEAKYLFFIDDDVAIPSQALRVLIYHLENADPKVMVIGGIYCAKTTPTEPIVYKKNGEGAFWQWKRNEVFECSGIGTGCMLIKTELFKHLSKPYFKTLDVFSEEDESKRLMMTDDLYFCKKVTDAGFKILADGSVLCVHWDVSTMTPYLLPPDSYPLRGEEAQEVVEGNVGK